jgi:hypothetical protein
MVSRGRSAILALAVICLAAGMTPAPAGAAEEARPAGVREFMTAGDTAEAGVQVVEGVVSQVLPGSHQLALIDAGEFRECEVVTCAKLTLPVRWQGDLPAVTSLVRVTGSVEKQGMRRIFSATRLEIVKPPRGVLE